MPGQIAVIADCLFPTPLSQYDPNPAPPTPKQQSKQEEPEVSLRPNSTPTGAGGRGRGKKRRPTRGRGRGGRGGGASRTDSEETPLSLDVTARAEDVGRASGILTDEGGAPTAIWSIMNSSESEFSDTEGGRTSKLQSFQSRVRLAALLCLHAVVKVTT